MVDVGRQHEEFYSTESESREFSELLPRLITVLVAIITGQGGENYDQYTKEAAEIVGRILVLSSDLSNTSLQVSSVYDLFTGTTTLIGSYIIFPVLLAFGIWYLLVSYIFQRNVFALGVGRNYESDSFDNAVNSENGFQTISEYILSAIEKYGETEE